MCDNNSGYNSGYPERHICVLRRARVLISLAQIKTVIYTTFATLYLLHHKIQKFTSIGAASSFPTSIMVVFSPFPPFQLADTISPISETHTIQLSAPSVVYYCMNRLFNLLFHLNHVVTWCMASPVRMQHFHFGLCRASRNEITC